MFLITSVIFVIYICVALPLIIYGICEYFTKSEKIFHILTLWADVGKWISIIYFMIVILYLLIKE